MSSSSRSRSSNSASSSGLRSMSSSKLRPATSSLSSSTISSSSTSTSSSSQSWLQSVQQKQREKQKSQFTLKNEDFPGVGYMGKDAQRQRVISELEKKSQEIFARIEQYYKNGKKKDGMSFQVVFYVHDMPVGKMYWFSVEIYVHFALKFHCVSNFWTFMIRNCHKAKEKKLYLKSTRLILLYNIPAPKMCWFYDFTMYISILYTVLLTR